MRLTSKSVNFAWSRLCFMLWVGLTHAVEGLSGMKRLMLLGKGEFSGRLPLGSSAPSWECSLPAHAAEFGLASLCNRGTNFFFFFVTHKPLSLFLSPSPTGSVSTDSPD